jgi:hypothetical protein
MIKVTCTIVVLAVGMQLSIGRSRIRLWGKIVIISSGSRYRQPWLGERHCTPPFHRYGHLLIMDHVVQHIPNLGTTKASRIRVQPIWRDVDSRYILASIRSAIKNTSDLMVSYPSSCNIQTARPIHSQLPRVASPIVQQSSHLALGPASRFGEIMSCCGSCSCFGES